MPTGQPSILLTVALIALLVTLIISALNFPRRIKRISK